jgi:hypothetical protein
METLFNIRFPWEFTGFGNGWKKAIKIWSCYYWKINMCNVWIDTGFRLIGFEIVRRKWI